ncbi:MAG: response regulator [Fibromonadaceae bacterium]|jgi:two-component system chemotaxis response regulator CheY|nr:response regulator [Fibromonadaceae bacterium]
MRTLIVDDEIFNCKLLQTILKEYGECTIAMNGSSAITLFEEALKTQPYDLICLDIMMPEMDGYEVLRTIRNMEQKASAKASRIIMVTALEEQEDKAKAFHENCDGYLTKPIERNLLIEMLAKMSLVTH